MLGGIALLGVVTATLASWIIDRVREENDAQRAATWAQVDALRAEVRALKDQRDMPHATSWTGRTRSGGTVVRYRPRPSSETARTRFTPPTHRATLA